MYSSAYYPDNIHFFWTVASMEGGSVEAIAAARNLVAKIPAHKVKQMPET
ncbi:hypothetical protein RintRC_0337 [Richelia intracellularis]|nr:hypothetical protein RintRC_0337 [Richelia intracellularis]